MTATAVDPDAAATAKGEAEEQARAQRNLGWKVRSTSAGVGEFALSLSQRATKYLARG